MKNQTTPATPVSDALRHSGEWNEAWDRLGELDPVWTEKFLDMASLAMRSGALDPLTVEFIAIAVDASCTHLYSQGVRRHIRRALDLGATQEQILAVLQCVSVLGIHSCALGVPILVEELSRASGRSTLSSTAE
jgi:alkylhydroperoxidase/carboxymuconolactone decarboxylase family protein YurZ